MFFRKMKNSPAPPTPDELSELDLEIQKYESMIENAPLKLLEQRERERTTMPPPDDFIERRRERRFYAEMTKGQIANERKYHTRNTVLFVLLAAATISVCWWIYSSLVRYGIIS